MIEVMTFRQRYDRAWKYEHVLNGERVGTSVSSASDTIPARVEGQGISWSSLCDPEITLIPGIFRTVMNSRTGEEDWRMTLCELDLYEIRSKTVTLQAEIRNESYFFGEPGMPAFAMTEKTGRERPYYRTLFFDPADKETMLLVLAFTALKF